MTTETLEIKAEDAAELQRLFKTLARILHHPNGRTPVQRHTKPFDFSARVTVRSQRKSLRPLQGKTGTVMGRAPARDGWLYTVFIDESEECWSIAHDELKLSPKHIPKPRPQAVTHLRVTVDKHGRGHAAV